MIQFLVSQINIIKMMLKQFPQDQILAKRTINIKLQTQLTSIPSKLIKNSTQPYKSLNVSQNHSSPKKNDCSPDNSNKGGCELVDGQKTHEIYFSQAKKYNYMKNIIDKYFEQTKKDKTGHQKYNPEDSHIQKNYTTIIPRLAKYKDQEEEEKEEGKIVNKNRLFLNSKRKNKGSIKSTQEQLQLIASLDRSRLLVTVEPQGQADISRSMSFSWKNGTAMLPPIDEMFEDKDQQLQQVRYQSISFVNDSTIDPISKQQKITLQQNQICIVQMVLINARPKYKLKTFKEKGEQILKRQIRAHLLGVESVWISYKYDPRCLISGANRNLKQLLFRVKKMDSDSKFYTIKTKKYYKKIIANNCEELKRVLRQFSEFMNKFTGKILNNKINISNLFLSKNENIRLGEWGFSSFKQTHMIQNMQFQNRIEPIIKSQNQWFVPPQYLAPQIKQAILGVDQQDLMNYGAAPDIWSLGIAILEILTVIPVWITQKCVIYGKNMAPRTGLLAFSDRDMKKMLKKQEKLTYLISKLIEQEFSQQKLCPKVLQVLTGCLQFNPERRITYQEIVAILK